MAVRRIWAAIACCVVVVAAAPAHASTEVVGGHRALDHRSALHERGSAHVVASAEPVGRRTVRITGRTLSRHGHVAIQRRTHTGWRTAGHARIRKHRFTRELRQRARGATYRVIAAHGRSRALSVRLPATRTAPTRTTATSDACGRRPTKPDGSLWSCTFDDEFAGTSLDRTKWLPQTQFTTGTPDAFACYRDDPSNIAVSGGSLALTVRRESAPQPCAALPGQSSLYTAGMVSTYHLFSQQYGRFEARMKSPTYTGSGLQDDFWLWPDDRVASTAVWPAAGEIDVMEHYSQYAGLDVPFLHYGTDMGSQPGVNTAYTCSIVPGAFNTYTLTWSPTRLEIDVNGRPCLVNTSGDVAFQKPYILALTQALGTGTNALTAATPLPATVQIDYVRVWS
ncbi:MAG: glycoside hydrolase family 16 protein [Marmoricola sp.]